MQEPFSNLLISSAIELRFKYIGVTIFGTLVALTLKQSVRFCLMTEKPPKKLLKWINLGLETNHFGDDDD